MDPSLQKRFRAALDKAFDQQSMSLLIADYFAPTSFEKIVDPTAGTFPFRLLKLTEDARMDDWLLDLVAAAHDRRPRNPELTALATELGLTSTGPRLINPIGKSLEAIVQKNARFINPAKFLETLATLEQQVCIIEIPGGGGTGFLVGPDLILTNQHVVSPIQDHLVAPQDVKVRFDYRQAPDGSVLKRQTTVKLHTTNPIGLFRPYHPSDVGRNGGEPSAQYLDFALVRLEEEIASVPVNGLTADAKAQPRGFVPTKDDSPAVAAGQQVFILTHPDRQPLQLSIGTVTGFNASGTRVRYDANSLGGSSGSPVFDADLKLVALHHGTDPTGNNNWNRGIPFGLIQKLWHAENVSPGA